MLLVLCQFLKIFDNNRNTYFILPVKIFSTGFTNKGQNPLYWQADYFYLYLLDFFFFFFSEWSNIWSILFPAVHNFFRIFRPAQRIAPSIPLDFSHFLFKIRFRRVTSIRLRIRQRKTTMQSRRLLSLYESKEIFVRHGYGIFYIFAGCDIFSLFVCSFKNRRIYCSEL